MRLISAFWNDFADVLSNVVLFGKECNTLTSPSFEAFMETVKTRKPDVHVIINTFGRNYNPKTNSFNLTEIPMLVRLYGQKAGRRENREISKTLKEKKKTVGTALEKAKIIRKQRFRVYDRRLIRDFIHSLQRDVKEQKNLRTSKEAERELRKDAPPWFLELDEIIADIQKAVPELSRPALKYVQR